MRWKQVIRRLIPDGLRGELRILLRNSLGGGYFGLNGLDRKLEQYVDYDNGFFVELGANDGITQSNSYYFETRRGWHGVLVEPIPHQYLKCRKRRGSNSKVFCNACVGFDYKDRFVEIIYSNLMSVPRGLESDLGDVDTHVQRGRKFLREGEENFIFGALARPLTDILAEAAAPEVVDFLSLDVEGAELEVLKGVDFNRFRFKYILVECRNIAQLEGYLRGFGYEIADRFSGHDFLFRHAGLQPGTA